MLGKRKKPPVWLVELPAYQYTQDVKALARKHQVRIIDASFASGYKDEQLAKDMPKLTKKRKDKAKQAKQEPTKDDSAV